MTHFISLLCDEIGQENLARKAMISMSSYDAILCRRRITLSEWLPEFFVDGLPHLHHVESLFIKGSGENGLILTYIAVGGVPVDITTQEAFVP